MGFLCCFGSAAKDKDAEAPLPARIPNAAVSNVQVQRTWHIDSAWAAPSTNPNDHEKIQKTTMQQRVQRHIDTIYPQCAIAESNHALEEMRYRLKDGTCSPHTSKKIMVLDDNFTGVLYSLVLIVNLPAEADLTPGTWLDSAEMREAKAHILDTLSELEASNVNVLHAIARVFVGGDSAWCRYRPDNTECTITPLQSEFSRHINEKNDEVARVMRKDRNVPRGLYRRFFFERTLGILNESYPGCTVWDEGALPFSIGGKPFTEPTRLLVARAFGANPEKHYQPDEDVDAKVYRVNKFGEEPGETPPLRLLQGRDRRVVRGGIVAVALLVGTPLSDVWPKTGAYAKSTAMRWAKIEVARQVEAWNREGKIEHCNVTVWMGADVARFKFISENFGALGTMEGKKLETKKEGLSGEPEGYPSLDSFYVELREDDEHQLFESEAQFQAIKQLIRQRQEQNPERYRAMAPHLALMTAQHFLEANYAGCDISDEGEFPVVIDGIPTTLNDTRFVVAKDPKKETHNVLAAMCMVPLPGDARMSLNEIQDRNWLGTAEMAVAEQALLAVLKQWYGEGRLADDCMAQVVMSTDVSIYRFVEGERFEDYPEERMQQFKWQ